MLQDHGFVGPTPTEIAQFFHYEPKLHRSAIGDYIGEKGDLFEAVMHAYVDQVGYLLGV